MKIKTMMYDYTFTKKGLKLKTLTKRSADKDQGNWNSYTLLVGVYNGGCCCLLSRVQLFATHGLYSPPGSFVQGISQARTLEWIAISFSKGIFPTQELNPCLVHWQNSLLLRQQGSPRKE